MLVAALLSLAGCSERGESVAVPEPVVQTRMSGQAQLTAMVTYSGQIEKLPAEAVVFVYAREVGKTMPLAVERFTPDQLPMQVGFSNPGAEVSAVEVVARLSLTGAVARHPGDQEIVSAPIAVSNYAQSLPLVIPAYGGSTAAIQDAVAKIRAKVSIDTRAEVSANARVFVIARMPNSAQPMPVAVKALGVQALDDEIVLTDADSMTSVAKLSRHDQLEIVARLSRNGTARREVGDWESATQLVPTSSDHVVDLKIDQLVE
jgi:hypothetical protein